MYQEESNENKHNVWIIKDRVWYTKSSRIQLLFSDIEKLEKNSILHGTFLIYTPRKNSESDKL